MNWWPFKKIPTKHVAAVLVEAPGVSRSFPVKEGDYTDTACVGYLRRAELKIISDWPMLVSTFKGIKRLSDFTFTLSATPRRQRICCGKLNCPRLDVYGINVCQYCQQAKEL